MVVAERGLDRRLGDIDLCSTFEADGELLRMSLG